MNCPVCKTATLAAHELNPYVVAQRCGTCGGQWISSFEFWRWLEANRQPQPPPPAPAATLELTTPESRSAKLCPECGRILVRYKVGHSLNFSLERCGNCGGTWFDRNEWEILQNSTVRDKIHLIFSAAWQQQVRNEDRALHLEKLFKEKVGEKDFAEIRRIKDWLKQHPRGPELRTYLNSDEF